MTSTTPAKAKKPADHKPKAEKQSEVLTTTVRGVEFSIPLELIDDFEFLGDIASIEDGDVTRLAAVGKRLLGDQYSKLLDLARDPATGRVSITAGGQIITEVLDGLNPSS